MEEKIVLVLNEMSEYLSIAQMKKLQEVILKTFSENEAEKADISNEDFLAMFLSAKKIEGCSERTIRYYEATVQHLLSKIKTSVRRITTEEIREYLSDYQQWNHCSNVTIDNVRRNISSFFSWLEEEVDGIDANFSGSYPTLVVHNDDQPGHVADVTAMLAHKSINIATMQLYRAARGGMAVMVIECDQEIPERI